MILELQERLSKMALKLEITEMELHQIFNAAADPMWIVDRHQRVQRVNDRMLELIQKTRDEVIGSKCKSLIQSPMCGTVACPMKNMGMTMREVEIEFGKDLSNDATRHFLVTTSPFTGFMGELLGVVIAYKDITKRKEFERQLRDTNLKLERLTTLDGLTKVTNRRGFDEYLYREWGRMRRNKMCLSLIMGDIDFFKCYNDTYGHQAGDDCLRVLAKTIQDQAQRSSDMVARYGGEEFAVILPETYTDGALLVAERVRSAVEALRMESKCSPISSQVTLSLGVGSIIPGADNSPADLIKMADDALYRAKKNGRNQVAVNGSLQTPAESVACVGIFTGP